MPITVDQNQPHKSALSKIAGGLLDVGKVVGGAVTGNPLLIAGGVSSLAGDVAKPGSGVSKLAGLTGAATGAVNSASNIADQVSGGSSPGSGGGGDSSGLKIPNLGESSGLGSDAMSRRLSLLSPSETLAQGISALSHPDTPSLVAQHAAPYLLGAQHFGGPHSAIDQQVSQLGPIPDQYTGGGSSSDADQ